MTSPLTTRQLDEIETAITTYQQHPPIGFACCTAHAVADQTPALVAEIKRLKAERRTLTAAEYTSAWHAVEGAAGEEGADPATVLNAVLAVLGIDPPPHAASSRG